MCEATGHARHHKNVNCKQLWRGRQKPKRNFAHNDILCSALVCVYTALSVRVCVCALRAGKENMNCVAFYVAFTVASCGQPQMQLGREKGKRQTRKMRERGKSKAANSVYIQCVHTVTMEHTNCTGCRKTRKNQRKICQRFSFYDHKVNMNGLSRNCERKEAGNACNCTLESSLEEEQLIEA